MRAHPLRSTLQSCGLMIALLTLVAAANAQTAASQYGIATSIERAPDGRPKLDGIWQALVPANWDIRPHAAQAGPLAALGARGAVPPGLGIVDGGEIPYQPWALEQQRANQADQLAGDAVLRGRRPPAERARPPRLQHRLDVRPVVAHVTAHAGAGHHDFAVECAHDPPPVARLGCPCPRWIGPF